MGMYWKPEGVKSSEIFEQNQLPTSDKKYLLK